MRMARCKVVDKTDKPHPEHPVQVRPHGSLMLQYLIPQGYGTFAQTRFEAMYGIGTLTQILLWIRSMMGLRRL